MAFEELRKIIKFFKTFTVDRMFVDIVRGDAGLQVKILDLNRINQLFNQGIDSQGSLVGVYSFRTQEINPSKQAGTHFTFRDTGIFFDSFRIVTAPDFIEIVANPIRDRTNLFDKYTPDLVGLTNESKEELGIIMQPLIEDFIRKKLNRL